MSNFINNHTKTINEQCSNCQMPERQALHVEQDIVLWTNSQCPPDDVHVMADVHSLNVDSARGRWEQASQDRSDEHQTH